MSLDTTLGALLEAHLAPVRSELERLSAEVVELRRTLPPMLVLLREAARRMGVSYATARRRVDAHEWPARRDGGRILADLGALRPFTDENLARLARRARDANTGDDGVSDGPA
jgi:hypothetical protein